MEIINLISDSSKATPSSSSSTLLNKKRHHSDEKKDKKSSASSKCFDINAHIKYIDDLINDSIFKGMEMMDMRSPDCIILNPEQKENKFDSSMEILFKSSPIIFSSPEYGQLCPNKNEELEEIFKNSIYRKNENAQEVDDCFEDYFRYTEIDCQETKIIQNKSSPTEEISTLVSEEDFKNYFLIKKYHFLQEAQITELDPGKKSMRKKKYSQRTRFPKLNNLFGERMIYRYEKGELVETKALRLNQEKINQFDNHFLKTKELLRNELKVGIKRILNLNKSLRESQEKINTNLIKIQKLGIKLLMFNSFMEASVHLKFDKIRGPSIFEAIKDVIVIITESQITYDLRQGAFIIPPQTFFSVINISIDKEYTLVKEIVKA
jgi:hypothetical protein